MCVLSFLFKTITQVDKPWHKLHSKTKPVSRIIFKNTKTCSHELSKSISNFPKKTFDERKVLKHWDKLVIKSEIYKNNWNLLKKKFRENHLKTFNMILTIETQSSFESGSDL